MASCALNSEKLKLKTHILWLCKKKNSLFICLFYGKFRCLTWWLARRKAVALNNTSAQWINNNQSMSMRNALKRKQANEHRSTAEKKATTTPYVGDQQKEARFLSTIENTPFFPMLLVELRGVNMFVCVCACAVFSMCSTYLQQPLVYSCIYGIVLQLDS